MRGGKGCHIVEISIGVVVRKVGRRKKKKLNMAQVKGGKIKEPAEHDPSQACNESRNNQKVLPYLIRAILRGF